MTNPEATTDTTLAWFQEQVAFAPAHHDLMVGGRSIHYRSWGWPCPAQIVLVHGGAANGAWWDHIAPSLAQFGQVHAIDLAGHGQSDWAPEYTLEGWADDVTVLADHVSTAGEPTVLIGHSRGGFLALLASAEVRAKVVGVVLIESAFGVDPPAARPATTSVSSHAPPPTREQMIGRFRPHPQDVPSQGYMLAHIADQSVVESDGRWRWRFDGSFLGRVSAMRIEQIRSTTAKALQIRGSHGLLTATTADAARTALSADSQIVVVDGAGHHIMLQKPRELASLLCSTLTSWLHPEPSAADRSECGRHRYRDGLSRPPGQVL